MSTPESPPRRATDHRAQIIERVTSMLWEHPLRELTISRVMKDSGLSRPAFYMHFESMTHLMEQLLLDLEQRMVADTSVWLMAEGEGSDELYQALGAVVRTAVEAGPVFRAIAEAAPTDERLEAAWEAFLGRWDDAVAARIERSFTEALAPGVDAQTLARTLNRMDAATLIAGFGRRPQQDPEATLEALVTVWRRPLQIGTRG